MGSHTPHDYAEPRWAEAGRVHDWRNYVSCEIRLEWPNFTLEQRAMLARQAQESASSEEWE